MTRIRIATAALPAFCLIPGFVPAARAQFGVVAPPFAKLTGGFLWGSLGYRDTQHPQLIGLHDPHPFVRGGFAAMFGPFPVAHAPRSAYWYGTMGAGMLQLAQASGRSNSTLVRFDTERTLAPEASLMLGMRVHRGVRIISGISIQHITWSSIRYRAPSGLPLPDAVLQQLPQGLRLTSAHLRSKDFFDTENHPEITFRSTHIEKAGVGFQMAGDLTIARVTRRIALEVELVGRGKDPLGTERIGFNATTVIDRRDFGLVWSQVLEAGALLIGEKVKLEIWVEAVRRAGMSASGARW